MTTGPNASEYIFVTGGVVSSLGKGIAAATLLVDHRLVDPARGDIVLLRQRSIDEALVVSEVEIGFGAVIGDEHFAVWNGDIVPGSTLI